MTLTGQTKTLLAVAGILLFIYLFYRQQSNGEPDAIDMEAESEGSFGNGNAEEAEGFNGSSYYGEDVNSLPENEESYPESEGGYVENFENNGMSEDGSNGSMGSNGSNGSNGSADTASTGESKYNNVPIPREEMIKYFPQKDYAPPESDWLRQKFNSRNKAQRGVKRSSYSAGMRGNLGPSQWDDFFEHNNNVISNSQTGENDKFLPIDESNGGYAVFKNKGRATCGSNQNCEPEDLFDVDKYLPQEVNDDWFEVQPEPISVKNRHLINITKPIGINTIGTSLKNASYDIRGTPANPKYVVSPFLNSSIEPDVNLKPLL